MGRRINYLRTLHTQRVWTRWVGLGWAGIGALSVVRDEFLPTDWQPRMKLLAMAGSLSWQWWTIIFLIIVIIALFESSYRAHRAESDARIIAENQLKPKIDIRVDGRGIAEEKDEHNVVVGKRVQVVIKSLTDSLLADCQVEIERVERINVSRSTVILNERLRVEWSNEDNKFGKITIPTGVEKQVNLFYILCKEGEVLKPIIPSPKRAFIEGMAKPGQYSISILVSSISASAARAKLMLTWSDYQNVSLELA